MLLAGMTAPQHVPLRCPPAKERHSCTSSAVAPRVYSSSAAATRQRAASSERARLAAQASSSAVTSRGGTASPSASPPVKPNIWRTYSIRQAIAENMNRDVCAKR